MLRTTVRQPEQFRDRICNLNETNFLFVREIRDVSCFFEAFNIFTILATTFEIIVSSEGFTLLNFQSKFNNLIRAFLMKANIRGRMR